MRKYSGLKFCTLFVALAACVNSLPAETRTVQEQVHHRSPMVMPFDMAKTLHIYKMTEQGGFQQVVVRESRWADQVPLIQQHLKHEARQFQQGNYSDPAALHGTGMPGLQDLSDGAANINVTYQDLPNGGEITFETTDLNLLTAIHRWFGAQLSEHGADARAE